jgi:hypothetical protein
LAVAAAGVLAKQRAVALFGLAAVAHDIRDFPWRDVDNH